MAEDPIVPFSETLKVLLHYSKTDKGPFTYQSLKKVLAPLYHEEMRLRDVIQVIHGALLEMLDIKEFEIGNRKDIQLDIIISPIAGLLPLMNKNKPLAFGPELTDTFTIEEFYNRIISEYMHKIMFTNIGWCREYIFGKEK